MERCGDRAWPRHPEWTRQRALGHLLGRDLSARGFREHLPRATWPASEREARVGCLRTMPFEPLEPYVRGFCGIYGRQVDFSYSDYDLALTSGHRLAQNIDTLIVWMDWRLYAGRLGPDGVAAWMKASLERLDLKEECSVLVNNWPSSWGGLSQTWVEGLNQQLQKVVDAMPGLLCIDLVALEASCGPLFDLRNDRLAKYPISARGTLMTAREIGLRLLAPRHVQPLRGMLLDLDNTLYRGVLGEDGPEAVVLQTGHRKLQELLVAEHERGMLLGVVSRNEQKDVEKLFASRPDFPLQRRHLSVVEASWEPKKRLIESVVARWNFDPMYVLFLDDNLDEICSASEISGLHLLEASENADETLMRVENFPWRLKDRRDEAAGRRHEDVRANQLRAALRQEKPSYAMYLADLAMHIEIKINQAEDIPRLSQLSQKTNQFNLALGRLSEAQVRGLTKAGHALFGVHLSDRLSDSGLIGGLVSEIRGKRATIIDFFLSCRSFGRDIELVMLREALDALIHTRHVEWVTVSTKDGPRNHPAIAWWTKIVAPYDPEGGFCATFLAQRVHHKTLGHPAQVTRKGGADACP